MYHDTGDGVTTVLSGGVAGFLAGKFYKAIVFIALLAGVLFLLGNFK